VKTAIFLALAWTVMALLRIPQVESWSFLPDGDSAHWWGLVGIRLVVAATFAEIACLRRKLG